MEAPGSNPGIPTSHHQFFNGLRQTPAIWRAFGVVGDEVTMEIAHFQSQMRALYGDRDRERGLARTFAWFTEECGELSRALFRGDHDARMHEFSDVLAWLASLAEQAGVDLDEAARRYAGGCPRCAATPCACGARP